MNRDDIRIIKQSVQVLNNIKSSGQCFTTKTHFREALNLCTDCPSFSVDRTCVLESSDGAQENIRKYLSKFTDEELLEALL